MKHPARYTDALLPIMSEFLLPYNRVLDPFGGTGKLHEIRPDAVCMDIEREWAQMSGLQADATQLPFGDGMFDAVCTSPTYGNRMADKTPGRVSYAAYIGRPLSANNSGGMQWGDTYRQLHVRAWLEAWRVLRLGGALILNIKDHIRNKERVRVTDWHIGAITKIGFIQMYRDDIDTPGAATHLTNGDARVGYESVILFEKVGVS